MSEIFVIGIDSNGLSSHHDGIREKLQHCGLIVCSKRLAACLDTPSAEIFPITPLQEAFARIERGLESGNVAVLASGDPLLFGIGSRIIEHFGGDRVQVFPALSSLQEGFAKFKISWTDATIISLHGRNRHHIPGLLLCREKTFVFTDSLHTPAKIAAVLLAYLECIGEQRITKNIVCHVAENLGMEGEKVRSGSLAEIAHMEFAELNVLCLIVPDLPTCPVFGLREGDFAHSRGLITKDEVRAATLHRLHLPRSGVFWDIGGGSGSVSIEAAALSPRLTVYTVEHKDEELANIKENIRRYGLFNIVPSFGRAADLVADLPPPDGVFVGGSSGELEEIIATAVAQMEPGARIVVNGVTEKTITRAPEIMRRHGMQVESATITVEREGPDGPQSFNPITIMVGQK